MPAWLRIYHHLPYSLRVATASVRGYYLRFWRYGPESERLIKEALERESWDVADWEKWRQEQLSFILRRAALQVPYYRQQWEERRRRGDKCSSEYLENWPLLKKEAVRANPKAFISDDCQSSKMFVDHTSGTSGTPLSIYIKREALRHWYAIFEARVRRWHGVRMMERWAILGGQMVAHIQQSRPPFWVYNAGLRQLYLSTHHISSSNAPWYVEALQYYRPSHMLVYPSSAAVLAAAILDQGLHPPPLKVIFSNAETLLDSQRSLIEQAFRCQVRNTYGVAEYVAGASECTHGNMHLWPEIGEVEVLLDGEPSVAPRGEVGRLVVTGFLNADMPFIRYEVGDRGRLSKGESNCSCGRTLPMLETLEGRVNDLLVTPDGTRVFWLNPVFYGLPVREAQIIQEELTKVCVKYVPAPGFTPQDAGSIVDRLTARLGTVQVQLEEVNQVERGPNGKFKAITCNLSKDQIEQLS